MKTYQAQVVGNQGDLALVFSLEMMQELGWNPGDEIQWEITDNEVIVKKIHDHNNSNTDTDQ